MGSSKPIIYVGKAYVPLKTNLSPYPKLCGELPTLPSQDSNLMT